MRGKALNSVREFSIEDYLCQEVERHGGRAQKVIDRSERGHPDREVQWPLGLLCAGLDKVELKRPNGPGPEAHQTRYHKKLAKCGVPVYVLHTKDDVDNYIYARIRGAHDQSLWSVPLPQTL